MATGCRDVRELAGLCPSSDRIGVDAKLTRDLRGQIETSRLRATQERENILALVAPVATDRPEEVQLPVFGPSGDRYGVDAERRGDLGRRHDLLDRIHECSPGAGLTYPTYNTIEFIFLQTGQLGR